jgi:3-oxoacyl-(acyl-carrier-protein) synthase
VSLAGWAWRLPQPQAIPGEPVRSKHSKFLRRMALFGVEVAHEAFRMASLEVPGDRFGVFCGYGGLRAHWDEMMPALSQQTDELAGTWERGLKLLHPYWMLRHLSNNAHALVAADLKIRGDGATYGGVDAGAQAIAGAVRSLEGGYVDAALVMAYDSLREPETEITAKDFTPGEAAAAVVLTRSFPLPTGEGQGEGDSIRVGAASALIELIRKERS